MDPELMIPSYFGGYGPPARFRSRNNAIDAKKYDYRSNRSHLTHPNNLIESIAHMLMSGLGSGLVVLHAAYRECGIWASLFVNIIVSLIVSYCVLMLVWSAQKLYGRVQVAQLSYPDIMEAAVLLSPWPKFRKAARGMRYLVEGTLLIHLYGSCCVMVIMIARNLKELVSGDNTICDAGEPPLKVYIISLMVPCIVICMVTNLKNLAPFALICDLYAMALILCTLWYGFHDWTVSPLDRAAFKGVSGLFEFISVCVFVLEPVSYALPVENNMDEPQKFLYVILAAMPIFTASMMIIGFVGYWHYGEWAVAPITIHFPFSAFAVTLKVFLCIILYVIYAMCFYVAFDIEWFYLKRNHQMSNYWFWERLYRTIHVVVLNLIAYGLPNVTRMMGILGAFSTSPAIFVYPPLIELMVDWEYPGLGRFKWRLLKFIALMFAAFIVVFVGSFYNIKGMVLELSSNVMMLPNMSGVKMQDDDIFSKRIFPYTDLDKTDIDYNLTYNVKDGIPQYNITLLRDNSLVIRNFNFTSLLPYNKTNVLANFENFDLLPDNTIRILPFNNKGSVLKNDTRLMPNFNNTSLVLNDTTDVIPQYYNISLVTNNITYVLPHNSNNSLVTKNITRVLPYYNNNSLVTNNI